MASGKVHTRFNLTVVAIIAIATGIIGLDLHKILCLFGILFSTLLMSPDMDLDGSKPDKPWGILHILWNPYSKLMRHRGLSHNPILGTFSRIIYMTMLTGIIATIILLVIDISLNIDYSLLWSFEMLSFIGGLFVGDWLHLILDTWTDILHEN